MNLAALEELYDSLLEGNFYEDYDKASRQIGLLKEFIEQSITSDTPRCDSPDCVAF